MKLLLKIYDAFRFVYQKLLRFLLFCYKLTFSPILKFMFGGGGCRFKPTCSEYTVEVIEKYGIMKGSVLAFKRIASCNSWSKN